MCCWNEEGEEASARVVAFRNKHLAMQFQMHAAPSADDQPFEIIIEESGFY